MNDEYYVITMESRTGATLYLGADVGDKCTWIFKKDDAIWFETETEAITFAESYFKTFKNYRIDTVYYEE